VEQMSTMGFLMDSFLAFCPLVFTHRGFFDAGASGSLDFALRFFERSDKVDFNKWHLREVVTVAGAEGRTYSEARMWDESGKMIASMTQQCILRPPLQKPNGGDASSKL
jgi:acyl-CoA thioesterase